MKLSSFSDYTLRVLIFLALEDGRLTTIQDIAQAYAISKNHLMKVVHHLATKGIVESVRGKGGGIRLALPPDQIRLGRVLRESEGQVPIVECLGDHNTCVIARNCRLAGILAQAFEGMLAAMDEYTLAELVSQPKPLKRILQIAS